MFRLNSLATAVCWSPTKSAAKSSRAVLLTTEKTVLRKGIRIFRNITEGKDQRIFGTNSTEQIS
jgi:hypothetical protein